MRASIYRDPQSSRCGLLYRSASLAAQGGRACCAGGWPEDARERALLMGTDPVARGDRGYNGRRFVWQGGGGEGGSSSDAQGGSYVHRCLFAGCDHTVEGFGELGYLDNGKVDPQIKKVWAHELDKHGDMPMTKEEVEEACHEQYFCGARGGAYVGQTLAEGQAFRGFACLLGLTSAVPRDRKSVV